MAIIHFAALLYCPSIIILMSGIPRGIFLWPQGKLKNFLLKMVDKYNRDDHDATTAAKLE